MWLQGGDADPHSTTLELYKVMQQVKARSEFTCFVANKSSAFRYVMHSASSVDASNFHP